MRLEQFAKWKLLYEDETQCFSNATDIETENEVVIITHYLPESLSRPVKHLLSDHLHNILDCIEDENGFHIVLKKLNGAALSKYMKQNKAPYEARVQMVYDWLKSIVAYDQFPDVIKIQLVDVDQIVIVGDQMKSRELIDYSADKTVALTEVFAQIGLTIEKVLYDAKYYQSEFIDNLMIGTHSVFSFSLLRKQFKDIFIYEKTEALQSVNFEYNIIINDFESAGPALKKLSKQEKLRSDVADVPVVTEPDPSEFELKESPTIESVPKESLDKEELMIEDEPRVELEPEMDEHHDEDIPEVLPSATLSRKPRALDDEVELDMEMNNLFTRPSEHDNDDLQTKKKFPLIPVLIGFAIVLLMFFVGRTLLGNEPVAAHFNIEPLMESRVAFMNDSTGKKNIDEYLWEIYFEDEFVHSFTDENLFPIFETEGNYTIVLKAKDGQGVWSKPYSLEYNFVK